MKKSFGKDGADNRHFVQDMKQARERGKHDDSIAYKELYVSFRVLNVHEIDQLKQYLRREGHPHFEQFLEQWEANETLVAN